MADRLAALPLTQQLLTRCTFPEAGSEVTCAVSGGADSAALLVLAVAAGCRATAVHVDHQLRAGSAAEAEIVHELAEGVGAAFEALTVDVGDGPNLEARARAARFAALPEGVLTGHTADDQAETVLLNMLRGAATSGLAAMRPNIRRPLLALRRTQTAGLCDALGIVVVRDPSNLDPRHLRNRVRHDLLPLMNELARRDLVPVLTRQADLARAEADLLDELAATIEPTDAKALNAAPLPLARRAVRRWLTTDHPPDLATVERVLAVARGECVATETGDGRRVSRQLQRLQLHPWASTVPNE